MRRPTTPFVLFAALAGVLAAGEAQALYRIEVPNPARDPIWPKNQGIRVCFAAGMDANSAINKRIRNTVEDSWGRYSSIWFEDWGNCEHDTSGEMPDVHMIFIQNTTDPDGKSSSNTGRQYHQFTSKPRPTLFELNYNSPLRSFCDVGPGGASNDDCVTWTAVHEIGHALGFLHEHARPDFEGCWNDFDFDDKFWGGGNAVTAYDHTSVMNYCSSNALNNGQLTNRDIGGLQATYGFKPLGSIVGPGGRCLDVDTSGGVHSGVPVRMRDCKGGDNQRWIWSHPEGLLSPGVAPWACLDEGSFGATPGTPLDIWDCGTRAVPRWEMEGQFSVQGLGHTCLRVIGTKAEWNYCALRWWTYTPDHQLKVYQKNLCLTFGGEGSQPTVTACNAGRTDQKLFINHWGGLSTWDELCLEIPGASSIPFPIPLRTAARLAECNESKLTQRFYFNTAPLRNAHGWCMGHQPTDVPANGLRPSIQSCPAFFPWQVHIGPFF